MSAVPTAGTERQVFSAAARTLAGILFGITVLELGRRYQWGPLPWAAERPLSTDLLVAVSFMLMLRMGFNVTQLFPGWQATSPALRAALSMSFGFLALLAGGGAALKYFDAARVMHVHQLLLYGWIFSIPLTAQQSAAFLGVYKDLAKHLQNERNLSSQLFQQSITDALTGLPNRLMFHDQLGHALARAERTQQQLTVFFINLDRFKDANEALGHDGGDELLRQMGSRLGEFFVEPDLIARMGGDEFVAFASDTGEGKREPQILAELLVEHLSRPLDLNGRERICTASIGYSSFPQHGVDVNALIRNAGHALSQVKSRGGGAAVVYGPGMEGLAADRAALETELRRGIQRDELFLEYQPQVDASTGRVMGGEALVRWKHPTRGRLSPDRFIPIAEESSLIVTLDRWVLQTACRQMARWRTLGFDTLTVSVNLSARNFYRGDLVETVKATLVQHGLPGECLDLEITEGTLMSQAPGAVEVLRQLRALGVSVAIDDFGIGYSALGYLNRFPVNGLKIDRSLVADVWSSPSAAAVTTAVVAIGKSLNLKVVAEGVETEAQLEFLRNLGCHLIQGYLFSRPVEASVFEGLLREPVRPKRPSTTSPQPGLPGGPPGPALTAPTG